MASTYTSRLHLEKPDGDDDISVLAINGNSDIIEEKLAKYTWGTRITYGSNSRVDYWRTGFMVCVQVVYNVNDGAINSWTNLEIGTLPAGYRPASTAHVRAVVDRAGDEGLQISVGADGKIQLNTRYNSFNTSGDVAQGFLCFPAYQ